MWEILGLTMKGLSWDGAADSAVTDDDEMGLEGDREVEEMRDGLVCIIVAVDGRVYR